MLENPGWSDGGSDDDQPGWSDGGSDAGKVDIFTIYIYDIFTIDTETFFPGSDLGTNILKNYDDYSRHLSHAFRRTVNGELLS